MKTEDLIKEYMKTHKSGVGEGKHAELHKPVKPATPVTRKRA